MIQISKKQSEACYNFKDNVYRILSYEWEGFCVLGYWSFSVRACFLISIADFADYAVSFLI